MPDSILVAYATRYGSTQEVAEAVASALREAGQQVDLQPLKAVRTLEGVRAVVVGAPLYMFRWHKDAKRFLSRHRQALAGLPVVVFALGPFHDKEEEWQEARKELDKELVKFPWLAPVEIKVIGGKFDPAALRFPYSLIPAMKQLPPTDIRDFDAIRAWATGLVEKLVPAGS